MLMEAFFGVLLATFLGAGILYAPIISNLSGNQTVANKFWIFAAGESDYNNLAAT